MKRLLDKYKEGTLSPDELQALREQTKRMKDHELEQVLLDDWVTFSENRLPHDLVDFDRMNNMIDKRLPAEDKPVRFLTLRKVLRYAAILLFPVLLISTLYFYHKADRVSTQEMIVKAGNGERVSITLPDGTSVKINSDSELRYNPADFNGSTRTIHFEGEGYFDVTANPDLPFIIESQRMKLKVLGTTFNFLSRERLDKIEVVLLKGHVLLSSSGKDQELFENEKAIFDKKTGEFEVLKEKKADHAIHWLKHELYFKNASFPELLSVIERSYDVRFSLINCEKLSEDTFSGVLPSTNLETVMEILKKSYGFTYTITSNLITIEMEKK